MSQVDFLTTPAGRLLNDFRNKLIRETTYGAQDDYSYSVLMRRSTEALDAEQALIAEIKRLQALDRHGAQEREDRT